MKIAICGISGFIGSYLKRFFRENDYEVVGINRDDLDKGYSSKLAESLAGTEAVINLAGEDISQYWTKSVKERIYTSRVHTTHKLIDAINAIEDDQKPRVFINASAVGIYSSPEINTETSGYNPRYSYLSTVVHDWEDECDRLSSGIRCVILRFGIVLGSNGGYLHFLGKTLKRKVLIRPGAYHHPFPWIYINDLARVFKFAIDNEVWGVFNCVSSENITNGEFYKVVKKSYRPWLYIKIPDKILKLVLGEQADMIIKQQRAIPANLLTYGFNFECDRKSVV